MEEAVAHLEACRICANCFLVSEMDFMSLFEPHQDDFVIFVQNELRTWQLKISANDGLPQVLCGNCWKRFYEMHTFKLECIQAQQKFEDALRESCNDNDVNGLTQLNLLPGELDMSQANDYLVGDMPVDVAEVVVGLEAASEIEVPTVPQTVTDYTVFQPAITTAANFTDLSASAATLMNSAGAQQLINSTLMPSVTNMLNIMPEVSTADLPSESSAILPTVTTAATTTASELLDIPESSNISLKDEMPTMLETKVMETEMEEIVAQDLEEMLQGCIIPTLPTKKKAIICNFNTSNVNRISERNENISDFESVDADDYDVDMPATRVSGNPLACQYCYCPQIGSVAHLIYPNSDALSQHFFDEHDPNLPYTCPDCVNIFRSAQQRNLHVRQIHNTWPGEKCPMCLKRIRIAQELHEFTCSYVSDWECATCGEEFLQMPLSRLRTHERMHDPSKQMVCKFCKRIFIKRCELEMHERMHIEQPGSLFECSVCNASYSTEYDMKRHKYQVHKGELPVNCKFCHKGFVSKAFLERHLRHSHPEEFGHVATCNNCDSTFSSLHKLRNHLQRPRDENGNCTDLESQIRIKRRQQRQGIFPCPHCSRRFHLKVQLDKHLNTHDETLRPHKCEQCHVRCRSTFELQQHITVAHMNVKAFECEICSKCFGYKKDLQHHMLFHAEVNVHCPESDCDYVCKNAKALNDHIRHKHHLVTCEYCGETFTRQRLITHLRSVHRAEIDISTPMDEAMAAVASIMAIPSNTEEYNSNSNDIASPTTLPNCNGIDKVRVELVNTEPTIPPLTLQEQTTNTFKPLMEHEQQIDQYFFGSLMDTDNEIIVT